MCQTTAFQNSFKEIVRINQIGLFINLMAAHSFSPTHTHTHYCCLLLKTAGGFMNTLKESDFIRLYMEKYWKKTKTWFDY